MVKYKIIWFYMANHGIQNVEAESVEEANKLFFYNDDVKHLIVRSDAVGLNTIEVAESAAVVGVQ